MCVVAEAHKLPLGFNAAGSHMTGAGRLAAREAGRLRRFPTAPLRVWGPIPFYSSSNQHTSTMQKTTLRSSRAFIQKGVMAPRVSPRAAPMSRGALRHSIRVQAGATEEAMRAAEARWERAVREGKVRNVTAAEAGELMKAGWTLLDVRPVEEIAKSGVQGAVEVPLFVTDDDKSFGGILKQLSAYGMGGWWLGGSHMKPNDKFMPQVLAKIPDRSTPLVIGCQKGLRSLAAAEQLSRAGYSSLAWINGGFDTAAKGDVPTKDGRDIRYAGIGGLSEVLGWTEVQRQDGTARTNFNAFLGVAALVLLCDLLLFGYEFLQAYQSGAWNPFSSGN